MRKVITAVDRSDNPDNDLILLSGIKIEDYMEVKKEENEKIDKIIH